MAAARRAGRQPGKSDPIDALAVAHAALREPDLPAARLHELDPGLQVPSRGLRRSCSWMTWPCGSPRSAA
jgi:transposase